MLERKQKRRKISSTTKVQDSPKETKLAIDDFQIHNKRTLWNDMNDVLYKTNGFNEMLNNREMKEIPRWRAKAIAIDRISLRLFPILFLIIIVIYCSVYMSGLVTNILYLNIAAL